MKMMTSCGLLCVAHYLVACSKVPGKKPTGSFWVGSCATLVGEGVCIKVGSRPAELGGVPP